MKRSTFLKSLIAAPAAISVASQEELQVKADARLLPNHDPSKYLVKIKETTQGGYLVPPEWADALKEAMSKYPG